jgi:acetate kinase
MTAFFETAFFTGLPEEERYYAFPRKYFHKDGVKRWGYHGLFHEYNYSVARGAEKVVSVVLDAKSTVSSIYKNKPLSINLGYTPLEGIMSGTTCGDVDPGMVFYLMKAHNYSIFQIDEILKKQSGFLGLTGYDMDIAELFKLYGKDQKVTLAFDVYKNQILKYIGESIAVLEGVDAIIFSGDNAKSLQPLIYDILKGISFLGINLKTLPWPDKEESACVASEDSPVKIYVNYTSLPKIIFYNMAKTE